MNKYLVTIESFVNIKWNPDTDQDELLKEFNEVMFSVDSIQDLEKFIAERVVLDGNPNFIEGIGRVSNWEAVEDCVLYYEAIYTDINTEQE